MTHKILKSRDNDSSYCSCSSVADGTMLGVRTTVWHFANIMNDVEIGDDCMIGSYVQLDPHTRIGNRVRVEPFSAITGQIGDDCFIGPHVTFVDAKYPPGKRVGIDKPPMIGDGAIIGAGSIIMADVGALAVISAGSLVVEPVGTSQWVRGSPANVSAIAHIHPRLTRSGKSDRVDDYREETARSHYERRRLGDGE